MFSLSASNRKTVGPATMTKASRMKASTRLNSLRRRTPLSRPETADSPARQTTMTMTRSEEHTSELQSQSNLVCRLLLEKKKKTNNHKTNDRQHDEMQAAHADHVLT